MIWFQQQSIPMSLRKQLTRKYVLRSWHALSCFVFPGLPAALWPAGSVMAEFEEAASRVTSHEDHPVSWLLFVDPCTGAAVVERVDCSPPTEANPGSIPDQGVAPGFLQVGIVADDAAGRRVFSGDLTFPPPLLPGAYPFSLHFTLISSQDLVVESRPNRSEPTCRRSDFDLLRITHAVSNHYQRLYKIVIHRYAAEILMAIAGLRVCTDHTTHLYYLGEPGSIPPLLPNLLRACRSVCPSKYAHVIFVKWPRWCGAPGFSHVGIRAARCRWSAGFLVGWYRVSPAFAHSGAASYSPRFTFIVSQDLVVMVEVKQLPVEHCTLLYNVENSLKSSTGTIQIVRKV
ncbi:hypothetical protein PR048_029482 [Dryococelus australis]|uniref:Uncharacterized protein n=1 Tax=Dryococelus australis TaxID=614101 RepID=A0ABQ9GDG9_9NEOP|nr:hypothetical protein PR048_029482 [Dryococelus australis]